MVEHQTAQERCSYPYDSPLRITTQVPLEIDYLEEVDACTDWAGTTTYLKNTGSAVWRPRASAAQGDYLGDTLRAVSYRAAVHVDPYLLLTPGQVMVVYAAPGTVSWDLDVQLSLAWHAHDAVADEIAEYGEERLVAALKRKSPVGAALASCTLSVVEVADNAEDLSEKQMSEWIMLGITGAAEGSGCVAAVQRAEETEVQQGRRATLTAARLPRIRESQVNTLKNADTALTQAARWGKAALLVLKNA